MLHFYILPIALRPDSIILPCLSQTAELICKIFKLPSQTGGGRNPSHAGKSLAKSIQSRQKGQLYFEINIKKKVRLCWSFSDKAGAGQGYLSLPARWQFLLFQVCLIILFTQHSPQKQAKI